MSEGKKEFNPGVGLGIFLVIYIVVVMIIIDPVYPFHEYRDPILMGILIVVASAYVVFSLLGRKRDNEASSKL